MKDQDSNRRPVRRTGESSQERPVRRTGESGQERPVRRTGEGTARNNARRRNAERIRAKRRKEMRRNLLILAAAAMAILLVILIVVLKKNRPSDGMYRSDSIVEGTANTLAAGGEAAALSGTLLADTPAVSEESVVETPVPTPTPTPAPIVTTGSIDENGYVNFVNDPAYSEKVTILGTGDNLIHEALFLDAKQEDGSYDFKPMYARVKPYIEAADLATTNQETPLATMYGDPPSGYPGFNTPIEDGDALIDCGFDAINLATNHVYDKGENGLYATIDYCQSRNLTYFGAYYDADDRYNIRVKEVNGIKIALLGFVNYTNFEADNMGEQLIWYEDYDAVKSQITRAKEQADIVVCYVHWGEEYENVITDSMASAAQFMADCGADLIFGDHTHILQKISVLQRESDGKLVPIQYCGGNFISGQKSRASLLSCLTTAEFSKNPSTGDVVVTGLSVLPIVTHYIGDRTNVEIYPLEDYTEELAEQNGVKQFEEETMTLDYMWGLANAEIPEQFLQHVSH